MQKTRSIWLDGQQVPWDDARIHFFTHTLHYGLGVFEGIRCYRTAGGGSAVFRLAEHVRRLIRSAKACLLEVPFGAEELEQACVETVAANDLDECYIRPLIWMGQGPMGLGSTKNPIRVGIGVFPWGAYLGEEGLEKGIRCKVSSLTRISHSRHLTRAKITGQYVNSILANREAHQCGYDEAILLDGDGLVAEGSGENVFLVRDGVLKTPPESAPILPGITRASILVLARASAATLGVRVEESAFPRDELYMADEVFLTGTAAEVTPVREVDGRVVGAGRPGPVTRALAAAFADVVRGRDAAHADWLTHVRACRVA